MKLYEFPTKDLQTALKVIQAVQANRQERSKPKRPERDLTTHVGDDRLATYTRITQKMKSEGLSYRSLSKRMGISKTKLNGAVLSLITKGPHEREIIKKIQDHLVGMTPSVAEKETKPNPTLHKLADRIRAAMKLHDLSFGNLAKKCGITKSAAYNMVWNMENGLTVSPTALARITNVLFREPKKSVTPKKTEKTSVTAKLKEVNDKLTSFGEMLTGGPSELTQMSDSIRKTLEECEYDLIAAMEILSATYRPAEVWAVIVTEKLMKREKVQPMIVSALRQTRGHITEAAKKIGMHRPVMVNLITEWKLTGYCTPGGIDRGAK